MTDPQPVGAPPASPSGFLAAWRRARTIHQLPETPESRLAFYAGGRSVLSEVVDAFVLAGMIGELGPSLLRLNDDLRAFLKPPSDTQA